MARRKLKLTRPALKRQREALVRFERYLPMLKLKQQQLQLTVRDVTRKLRDSRNAADAARRAFDAYRTVLADRAGLDVESVARPQEIRTSTANVAGVTVPVFEGVVFPQPRYSLFATPAWVDRALLDLREVNRRLAELGILQQQYDRLHRELTKIIQRVNLFEKVMIPTARENIRRIRIHLGDEMTAAVGRAKIAKAKISESEFAAEPREVLVPAALPPEETPKP
ncbi:MAG TPA: V-type ATP synthase subunit D [Phycisphaerae bacterium]|nr:V-type ATP synthase subunit D [Phycisphaerae bacterium]